jgi:mannose-6-phosphate isomerase-like protein (cupin superfamily)
MAIETGDGWAVGNIGDMGEGPGFRKVRRDLGVTAFGVNAIVMPEGFSTGSHFHDEQEEVYFVHRGRMRMRFGDGTEQLLEDGGFARVDAATVRSVANAGEGDLVYVCFGGKDGYVGRDGHTPPGEERVTSPSGA